MLIVDVEYLMGRVIASSYNDRSTVEYPPHPSRLFSALVAAYKDNDLGTEARRSLEWLETLGDPSIYIEPFDPAGTGRVPVTYFVPANDSVSSSDKKSVQSYRKQPQVSPGIYLNRLRTERKFPSIAPADSHVRFIWNVADDVDVEKYIPGLRAIAENVTYLGHSSTPVVVRITTGELTPNIVPRQDGQFVLRTFGQGRMEYLERLYELRQRNPGIQPMVGRIVKYGFTEPHAPENITGSRSQLSITFRINSPQTIPGTAFHKFVFAARNAIFSLYPDPIPEIVSGHKNDGSPLKGPHLAVIPHIDMGHNYAKGHLMGFSYILPEIASPEIRSALFAAAAGLTELKMGGLGIFPVQLITADQIPSVPRGLDLSFYEEPSILWATVTPIILGKHPKFSDMGPGKDGGQVFREACQMAGVPQPKEVITMPASVFEGLGLARDFAVPSKFSKYLRMHAILRFHERIRGPIILGSGRFSGFGLMYPLTGGKKWI